MQHDSKDFGMEGAAINLTEVVSPNLPIAFFDLSAALEIFQSIDALATGLERSRNE